MFGFLRKPLFWLLGVDQAGRISDATNWEWYAAAPVSMMILGGLLAVGVLAAVLNLLPRTGMPWKTRLMTLFLRLLGFALLTLLIVQLELRVDIERSFQPNVCVVTDTSASMGIKDVGKRSRIEAARKFRETIKKDLGRNAHISEYALDWSLSREEGKEASGMTRLMAGLQDLVQKERDLQAVILLSDGNDTMGDRGAAVAPLYAARGLPVYPVTFGSPDAPRIPIIRWTSGSDYLRLGDELRLEATLSANQFKNQVIRASLFEGNATQPIVPPQEGVRIGEKPVKLRFLIKPDRAGRKNYRIRIDGIRGASSEKLLEAEHTVDVIDQKIRILYMDIPRPERKIIGHWLARDPVVDFAGLLSLPKHGWFAQGKLRHINKKGMPDNEADLYEYDVIIMGDIARSHFRAGDVEESKMRWLLDFVKRRGGGMVTLGGNSVYSAGQYVGSDLAAIMPFTIERTEKPQIPGKFLVIPTVLGLSHPVMELERDFEGNRTAWYDLPEVEGCNRVGQVRPGASLLAVRKIDKKELPVMAFQNVGKGRVLAMAIDTTWHWEFGRDRGSEVEGIPEATDHFRRFWGNMVRFLAPDPRLQPNRPQITRRKSSAAVGETVTLATRLIDRSFKPIRKADLTVRVISPSKKVVRMYPADSRSQPGVYEYQITLDEPGMWEVRATHKEEQVLKEVAKAEAALKKAEGKDDPDAMEVADAKRKLEFAKKKIAIERIKAGESLSEMEDPRSKADVMAVFAKATGGKAFEADETDELVKKLSLSTNRVKQSYAIALWNLPSVMVLFILIVCLDCLVRKRRGLV